jgi:hypothetical protein
MQCLGLAGYIWVEGSKIAGFLFLKTSLTDASVQRVDQVLISGLLLVALFGLRWLSVELLGAVGLLVFLEAIFTTLIGGGFGQDLAFFAHMARFGWLLLLAGVLYRDRLGHAKFEPTFLIHGLAGVLGVTFIAHGLEALLQHPHFIDLIIVANRKLLPFPATEAFASNALVIIGILDIICGVVVLRRPYRWMLGYMVFWGAMTAWSRFVFAGVAGLPDVLIRTPHWGIPLLALWLGRQTFRPARKSRPPEPVAERLDHVASPTK